MKKYFTKYLPINGTPEDHDIVIGPKGVHTYHDMVYGSRISEFKKAKLFLCSRDIQEGDQYFVDRGEFKSGSHTADKVTDKEVMFFANGNSNHTIYAEKNVVYKVIGEVSPEAVWVTEGMEFDRDEWGWYNHNLMDKPDSVTIECPTCKTFH